MDTSDDHDLLRTITAAREAGDMEQLAQMAMAAFADGFEGEELGEELLAWVSQVVYEEDLSEAFSVIPKFVTHFPHSRHGVRVYLADSHAERGEFDQATAEARAYLREVAGGAGLEAACQDSVVADWVLQAIQLLGTGYCFAGARTYGQEIYAHGISLSDDQGWKLSFEQAILQTERELNELDFREADFYWRKFLSTGERFEEVSRACDEMQMPSLKARMAALKDYLDTHSVEELPEFEFLMDLSASAQPSR